MEESDTKTQLKQDIIDLSDLDKLIKEFKVKIKEFSLKVKELEIKKKELQQNNIEFMKKNKVDIIKVEDKTINLVKKKVKVDNATKKKMPDYLELFFINKKQYNIEQAKNLVSEILDFLNQEAISFKEQFYLKLK